MQRFMPIDPNMPNEYKIKMLKDCSVCRILTSQGYRSIVEDLQNNMKDISVLYVDHIEVKMLIFRYRQFYHKIWRMFYLHQELPGTQRSDD